MNVFYKTPKDLIELWINKKITNTTLKLYFLMVQRNSISHFQDKVGRTYFIMTYEEIQKELAISKRSNISQAIKQLENLGILISVSRQGYATKYYMK